MEKTEAYGYRANHRRRYGGSNRNNECPLWCRALILTVLTAMEPVKQVFARTRRPSGSSPPVRINVRLYNSARVPGEILRWAEEDVSRIFLSAGVGTAFVDCPLPKEQLPSYPGCEGAGGPLDFNVKIITPAQAKHLPASNDSAGLAVLCGPRQASCTAYVNYDRVRELAPTTKVGPALVLGRVLAHELGHLLGLVHSASGLMRAEWSANDFSPDNFVSLVFTTWECKQIRAQASVRTSVSVAVSALTQNPASSLTQRAEW